MKLSYGLSEAGFIADNLETSATITMDNGGIISSDLILKAKVPGISEEKFLQIAAGAREECPVSKAL